MPVTPISIGLSNLRNLGRATDIDEMLRSQADRDESMSESTYLFLGGFLCRIPILGFIGTVLGVPFAIGQFGDAKTAFWIA